MRGNECQKGDYNQAKGNRNHSGGGTMLKKVSGRIADAGKFEDEGIASGIVTKGPHEGHTVMLHTAKYNCGAWSEEIYCSCGGAWCNAMYGCWQYNHQRKEEGDPTLKELVNYFYEAINKQSAED